MIELDTPQVYLPRPLILGLDEWAKGVMERPHNETIWRDEGPYIERWMLSRKAMVPTYTGSMYRPERGKDDDTPMPSEVENSYLHRYVAPDPEEMHCHPWPNVSIVISGRYVEETEAGLFERSAGAVVARSAEARHCIVDLTPGTVSLFLTGQKCREWGFYPMYEGQRKFVHHRDLDDWKAAHGR